MSVELQKPTIKENLNIHCVWTEEYRIRKKITISLEMNVSNLKSMANNKFVIVNFRAGNLNVSKIVPQNLTMM